MSTQAPAGLSITAPTGPVVAPPVMTPPAPAGQPRPVKLIPRTDGGRKKTRKSKKGGRRSRRHVQSRRRR
jgi:hypothetical protein